MAETQFADKLAALVAMEAKNDEPEILGVMIERLAAALGFTIALAARGNGAAIDELLAGAEGYAHREAVEKSAFARFMADIKNSKRLPPHQEP